MKLFPYERRRLSCLEGELRSEESELASKFGMLSGDDDRRVVPGGVLEFDVACQ